jgi:CRISPR system Cascade subunit CasB
MNEKADAQRSSPPGREERFVNVIIQRCLEDKGYAARLRRADNPATEYQSWEILAAFGVDLAKEYRRLPYAVIGAAIARAKPESNGGLALGRALAAAYEDGSESAPAKARLRRLLACQDTAEVCRVVRPLLALITSRVVAPLDYHSLLRQLLEFGWHPTRIKAAWAQDFYSRPADGEKEEAVA